MTPPFQLNTITSLRRTAIEQLRSISPSPALDVDMLLGEILGVTRAHLLAHGDQKLDEAQHDQFIAWVERAASGEPISYIMGRRGFYDLEFRVTLDVLIPRPETELLLEQALAWAATRTTLTAVDVGTGSGALAVTFAKHVPAATVYAVDISEAALRVAQNNALQNSAAVTFFHGDLLTPLIERGLRVDLVMANLPYIPSAEVPLLEVSRHEPVLALDGGADGLDLVRRLLNQLPQVCDTGTLVLLEIAAGQGAQAVAIANETLHPQSAELLLDYVGLDRIIRILI